MGELQKIKSIGGESKKITESAFKEIDPSQNVNAYRANDIMFLLEMILDNKVQKVFINDIFNMLFLPVPQLKEKYNDTKNKDYYDMMSAVLKEVQSSGMKEQTLFDPKKSTLESIFLICNILKQLNEQQNGQQQNQQNGQQQNQQNGNPQNQQNGQQQNQQNGNPQNQQNGQQQNQQNGNPQNQQNGNPQNQQSQQNSGSMPQQIQSVQDQFAAATLLNKLIEANSSQQNTQNGLQNELMRNGLSMEDIKRMLENVAKQAVEKSKMSDQDFNDPEKFKDMTNSFGSEKGSLGLDKQDETAKALLQSLDINYLLKLLKGIPDLFKEGGQEKKHTKHGTYDGYKYGSDIMSIASSARAYPEKMIYALIAHGQLPSYERKNKEANKDKYILFDKSGSMSDVARISFAKGISMALYLSSIKDGSNFHITLFDSEVYGMINALKNERRGKEDSVFELLSRINSDGGTDIQKAISLACADLVKDKKNKKIKTTTQLILITDGESPIDVEKTNRGLKEANAELIVIYLNFLSKEMIEKLEKVDSNMKGASNVSNIFDMYGSYMSTYILNLNKVSKHVLFTELKDGKVVLTPLNLKK